MKNSTRFADMHSSPVVIGATGGSGTRVFALMCMAAGYYFGRDLNPRAKDARCFVPSYDRWIPRWFPAYLQGRSLETDAMQEEFWECVSRHRAHLDDAGGRWGWKNPRSMYLLPFLRQQFPGLRFIHVVRDGRDMAWSQNQKQVLKHSEGVLPKPLETASLEVKSAAQWSMVNGCVADYGERYMENAYLRIRFESLCLHPAQTIDVITRFIDAPSSVCDAMPEISIPASIGRHRQEAPSEVAAVTDAARAALERFAYLPPNSNTRAA